MEGGKADQHCVVVEWSIENFTCWNNKVHGKSILQTDIDIDCEDFHLELYPKGISALDEYLVVRVYDENHTNNGEPELSIIDSKGSLLYKKTICHLAWKDDFIKIITNLIFKDVVKNIAYDPMFKDVIKLRYTRKCLDNSIHLDHTKVDAFDRLVRIPSDIFTNLPLNNKIETFFYYKFKGSTRSFNFTVSSIQPTVDDIECFFNLNACEMKYSNLVHCYLYVLNSDKSLIMFKEIEYIIADGKSWTLKHVLPKDVIKGLFSFIIRFKILSSEGYRNYDYSQHDPKKLEISYSLHSCIENYSKSVKEQPENPVSLLSKELMILYQDHDFSDFRLRCESITFPVHKNILSARSPVFKCMLTSDMKETASGCLDIRDLDQHTLGRFLAFLYSGDATGEDQLQWEGALKLYYAADKYQVPSLKAECAAVLKDQVSVSNVCDILALADKHQDGMLKTVVTYFILINYKDVLESKEWESFMHKDPLLLCKTLTLLDRKRIMEKSCDVPEM